jgi:hypothetical protein
MKSTKDLNDLRDMKKDTSKESGQFSQAAQQQRPS